MKYHFGDPCVKCGCPLDLLEKGDCPGIPTPWGDAWQLGRMHAQCGKPRIYPEFWKDEKTRRAYASGYDRRHYSPATKDIIRAQTTKALAAALVVLNRQESAEIERLRESLRRIVAAWIERDEKDSAFMGLRLAEMAIRALGGAPMPASAPTEPPDAATTHLDEIYRRLAAVEKIVDPSASAMKFLDGLAERLAVLEGRSEPRRIVQMFEVQNSTCGLANDGTNWRWDGDRQAWEPIFRVPIPASFSPEPAAPVWPDGCAHERECRNDGRCTERSGCPHSGQRVVWR